LIFRLTAKIVDKVFDLHSIYDTINGSPLDAFDRDRHAENCSCSIAHEKKKFAFSMLFFHCMVLNKPSFWLVVAVKILMVPYNSMYSATLGL
jgi:hypothetical protein